MILLLINDQGMEENLAFALRQLGYPYIVAKCDVEQIRESLSSHQIKCILLPLWGKGVVQLVQTIYQEHKIPYVLYTSYFSVEILQQVKKIPPPIYLTKIYNKDELYIAIELACHDQKHML
jgi:DNA-binding NtrC family response regulator